MKQSKAQLKTWFRRGKYPTEEQFADWMDSYHHKDETVPLSSVEGLTDRLNGKYNRTEGEDLERKHDKLSADFKEHKQENENEFKNVWEAIADEEERATTEETRLDGEIRKEMDRAKKAEEDETTRAKAAEKKNADAIAAEETRATGVENGLRTDLTAEKTRAKKAEQDEETRATGAETALGKRIDTETERATEEEGKLQAAITAEKTRATTEETAIRKEFAAADEKEKARAERAEGILTTNLATATADIDKIREMLKSGATLDEAKEALVALGTNYKDLHAVANTLKTFLEAKDTADSTINRWKEIEGFLSGITDAKTLTGLLEELGTKITAAYNEAITNQTVTFTAAGSRTAPATGEKLSTITGKIARWLADLKMIAFSGSAADVAETTDRKFVTLAEKTTWNGKASQAELTEGLEAKADKTDLPGAITGQEIESIFNQ